MARLKKDHSGYRSSGLYKKYQPVSDEINYPKKKRNTTQWCKGKVNVPHDLYKRYKRVYMGDKDYLSLGYTETFCRNCNKKFWNKTSVPLKIDIKHQHSLAPLPVKINGTLQKLSPDWFKYEQCWCGRYCNRGYRYSIKWRNLTR